MTEKPAFTCPLCERASWNPNDGANRFCGACGYVDEQIGWRVMCVIATEGQPGWMAMAVYRHPLTQPEPRHTHTAVASAREEARRLVLLECAGDADWPQIAGKPPEVFHPQTLKRLSRERQGPSR